jgi:DNA-binding IclR family transcriptional regulator
MHARATKTSRVRQVPSVTRAMAILRTLAASDTPLGVSAVARAVGIVPSTCLHILRALAEEGAVTFDNETKRYWLGAGLLPFTRKFLHGSPFVKIVQPLLEEFTAKWRVTTAAVQLSDERHFTVTNAANAPADFSLQIVVGTRFPALISATGRCFAAFSGWPIEKLATEFAKLKWQAPPVYKAWLKEVEMTRRRGYAVDQGNYIRGVTIIAAPVFDYDKNVSSYVCVIVLAEQISGERFQSVCADIVEFAAKVSAEKNRGPQSTRLGRTAKQLAWKRS